MLPTLYIRPEMALPDTDQWQFRFNIESETSNRLCVIGQHKLKKHWDAVARAGNGTGIASTCAPWAYLVTNNRMKSIL